MSSRVACRHCGQDWLRRYRIKGEAREFLLCPECESIWLPGQDVNQDTHNYLSEILNDAPAEVQWDLIEPLEI